MREEQENSPESVECVGGKTKQQEKCGTSYQVHMF